MKKIISILVLILILIAVSGYTYQNAQHVLAKNMRSGEIITSLNLDTSMYNNTVIYKYETLPWTTKNVTIEYNNLTSNNVMGLNSTYFQFVTYNVDAEITRKGDISASNVNKSNIIDIKTINLTSTPVSGKLTLNIKGAKSIGIIDSLGKGNVVITEN